MARAAIRSPADGVTQYRLKGSKLRSLPASGWNWPAGRPAVAPWQCAAGSVGPGRRPRRRARPIAGVGEAAAWRRRCRYRARVPEFRVSRVKLVGGGNCAAPPPPADRRIQPAARSARISRQLNLTEIPHARAVDHASGRRRRGRPAPPPTGVARTMRVDYFHTGDAKTEVFSFDEAVIEPAVWSRPCRARGRCARLRRLRLRRARRGVEDARHARAASARSSTSGPRPTRPRRSPRPSTSRCGFPRRARRSP